MLILDTDAMTILFRSESPLYVKLLDRLERDPRQEVVTTIASVHEQLQGWLSLLNRARLTPKDLINTYHRLQTALEEYGAMTILQFDHLAHAKHEEIRRRARRVATLDLRIASIALTRGATILTRNVRDFRQVPGLHVEDWSK
ncbi:MAG TPA: type II toxin-antitoxin system VapC family toxin [Gemmataceae bacterium]|nr:type II toxin-antitoxin system VapC family toxin [Gemmataceae bacterium]